jgi:hypothetical protein
MITVRTQRELQQDLEGLVRDTSNKRWTDPEFYRAMNQGLREWAGRVRYPMVYTIPDGWSSTAYEYTLPDYIEHNVQPQQKRFVNEWQVYPSADDTWVDLHNWHIEPNSSGGRSLRLDYLPYAGDGRILYWVENGPVPITVPVLSAGIDADDTTLTLASKPTIGRVGYVKADSEWMSYQGYTEAASTLTLTNLTRGLLGTTAASHLSAASVYAGIAADDTGLYQQLADNTMQFMMRFWLMNTSSREAGQYEKLLLLYQEQANRYWKRYAPKRGPRMTLTLQGTGAWW